ncbi:MAG: polymerase sigma factor RpoE [Myxococcaceae bacterium]|nr:polymerase sigma factor RpoE [Myxococcaceae bacterium]
MTVTPKEHQPTGDHSPRLRELFEEHGSFVCRSLRRLGIAEADLDDMLQEVFLVVYQRLSDYEERDKARSWLYSICTRIAHAQRRRLVRRRENVTSELPEGHAAATQQQSAEDREALVLGQRLLALLSAEQREVFVLYEVEDMTMQQIADAVKCPLQTAYSRLYKARERIGRELAQARLMGAST